MAYAFDELHWSKEVLFQSYHLPKTLPEAFDLLTRYQGRARVMAGGTDVIPSLRRKSLEAEALVDITGISGLTGIRETDGRIEIGPLTTHAQVASSRLIQEKAPLLATGAGWVGSPQIRNIGTVAGNLVGGQPAGDTSLPLLALGATVAIASAGGERLVPLTEFFLSPGKTVLDPSREILTRIIFKPLGKGQGSSYLRLSKRKALTLPILICAIVVRINPAKGLIEEAAIALGPVAPTPFRAGQAEDRLNGAPLTMDSIEAAAELARQESSPRDSCLRGSCDYRQEMVRVYVRRGLKRAIEAAGYFF
jgi:carbon-monoxide dehydrogenase medium subunit